MLKSGKTSFSFPRCWGWFLIVILVAATISCGLFNRSDEEEPKEIVVASTATLTATPISTPKITPIKPTAMPTSDQSQGDSLAFDTPEPTSTATPINGIAGDHWTPLTNALNLPDKVEHKYPVLAADGAGNLAMGWFQPNRGLAVITSADNGRTWSPPGLAAQIKSEEELSLPDHHWLTYANGKLYAAWVSSSPTAQVFSAVSPDNGFTWLQPTAIDDDARRSRNRYDARLVSAANDQLGATWVEDTGSFEIFFSLTQADSESWGKNKSVAKFETPVSLGELVRSGQKLYLSLVEKSEAGDKLYLLVSEDSGQSWQPPQEVLSNLEKPQFGLPQLAILAEEKVTMLVPNETAGDNKVEVLAASFIPGGLAQPRLNSILDKNGELATKVDQGDIVRSSNNTLYTVWSDNRDGTLRAYFSFSQDGQNWSPNAQLSQDNRSQRNLSLTIGRDDTLFVAGDIFDEGETPPQEIFLLQSEPDSQALASDRRPTATPLPPPKPAAPTARVYQLAYTKWDGRYHNLYIGDTRGSAEILIFARAAGPSFSPDGKRLYFIGEQGVTQQYRGEDRVICEFGTISDGIVAIDLMSPLRDICQVQYDQWFCERKHVDVAAEPSDVCTSSGISVYQNLDWKEGTARWTSVSPDNQAVAFDARPGGDTYRIYFRNVIGISQQARIEILGEQGSWSPDSQKIVYRSGRNNHQSLWISNRDDTNQAFLTNDGSDSFPTWSPDSKTIAFTRNLDNNVDIYIVGVDGQNVRRLTDVPGPDSLPVYTPSGQIVFRSVRTGSWGIWIMNGDGSGQHEIIPNAGVGPDWAFSRMSVR